MAIEIKNAIITKASLTCEDGPLSSFITLDYGGAGQGFGGYALYLDKSYSKHGGPNYCGHWIRRILDVAGVTDWSSLAGKGIRVKAEHSKVHAIGHIIKDEWFDPSFEFGELETESAGWVSRAVAP